MEKVGLWERTRRGYWATVYATLFHPFSFFAEPAATRSRWSPVQFFLLTQAIGLPVLAILLGWTSAATAGEILLRVLGVGLLAFLLTLPGSLIFHGAMRLLGSRTARLGDTFAAICFAAAPMMVLALTVLFGGRYLRLISDPAVLAIPLGRTHGVSMGRAVAGVLGGALFGLLMVIGLRVFLIEGFEIPSGSMIPTLQVGDQILVNKFAYRIQAPARGDLIVYGFPRDPTKEFIKRVVAVGGDTVEVRDNEIWLNGRALPRQPLDGDCHYDEIDQKSGRSEQRLCAAFTESDGGHSYAVIHDRGAPLRSWPAVTIGPGSVFVLGDNRDNSHDSRFWGEVPPDLVKGRAAVIWFSAGPEGLRLNRIGMGL